MVQLLLVVAVLAIGFDYLILRDIAESGAHLAYPAELGRVT